MWDLVQLSMLYTQACHVSPTGGPNLSFLLLEGVHARIGVICYSLAAEVVVICYF